MRGQTCFCQHYGIFRAATGGLLTPRTPVAHLAATSSARCLAFLTLERAHTRPYTILRQAVKSPSDAGRLRSSTTRLRGTFPLGFPECIRQTALPSVRGPHLRSRLRRGCCWLALFSLKDLQQPLFPCLNYRPLLSRTSSGFSGRKQPHKPLFFSG